MVATFFSNNPEKQQTETYTAYNQYNCNNDTEYNANPFNPFNPFIFLVIAVLIFWIFLADIIVTKNREAVPTFKASQATRISITSFIQCYPTRIKVICTTRRVISTFETIWFFCVSCQLGSTKFSFSTIFVPFVAYLNLPS